MVEDLTPTWILNIPDAEERASRLHQLCIDHYKDFAEERDRYMKLSKAYVKLLEEKK